MSNNHFLHVVMILDIGNWSLDIKNKNLMKLTIASSQLQTTSAVFLRNIGYTYIRDRNTGQESYVRRLTGNFYPRFHCYLFEQGGQLTFNLHLDQRPTRYEGARAHAGEYDSDIVRAEFDRLQAALERQISNNASGESFQDIAKQEPKRKWWPF